MRKGTSRGLEAWAPACAGLTWVLGLRGGTLEVDLRGGRTAGRDAFGYIGKIRQVVVPWA